MGRKKRRSSKFRDSSTVIDIEQAREERQQKQKQRQEKRRKMEARSRGTRSGAGRRRSHPYRDPDAEAAREASRGQGGTDRKVPDLSPEMAQRQNRRKMALRRRRRGRNLIIIGVLFALVMLVVFSFGNIIVLKHDLHVARQQQQQYKEEKEQMEKDMAEVNDMENLEEQARNQMRLIRPGETLYIFPENMTGEEPSAEDEAGDTDDGKNKEKEDNE